MAGPWPCAELERTPPMRDAPASAAPGAMDCQHGWWFPEREPGLGPPFGALESNANVLCGDDLEDCAPGTGAWRQTGIPGRLSRLSFGSTGNC